MPQLQSYYSYNSYCYIFYYQDTRLKVTLDQTKINSLSTFPLFLSQRKSATTRVRFPAGPDPNSREAAAAINHRF